MTTQTTIYTAEQKAKVIADFVSGSSQLALVRKYNIPRSTIRQWTRGFGPMATTEIKAKLDAEILKLTFTSIRTLRAILRHARNPEWLEKQSAQELGIFFGITADKLGAVLAAIERGQQIEEANEADESSSPS